MCGKAELLLGHLGQVGGEDDAAGVAGPRLGSERRVVLGQVGVAAVAEDALDEVEVGDRATGDDEARLHPLLAHRARYLGRHERAEQEGDEAGCRPRLVGRVRQLEVGLRRFERPGQQSAEDLLGDGDLVVGDREPALGDVEDPCGRATVVGGVVQDAVDEAVAAEQRAREAVAVEGQGELARQARLVEHEGAVGEPRLLAGAGEVGVEEVLDAPVGCAQPVREAAAQLTLAGEDRGGQPRRLGVLEPLGEGEPELGQPEVDGSVLVVGHTLIVCPSRVVRHAQPHLGHAGARPASARRGRRSLSRDHRPLAPA